MQARRQRPLHRNQHPQQQFWLMKESALFVWIICGSTAQPQQLPVAAACRADRTDPNHLHLHHCHCHLLLFTAVRSPCHCRHRPRWPGPDAWMLQPVRVIAWMNLDCCGCPASMSSTKSVSCRGLSSTIRVPRVGLSWRRMIRIMKVFDDANDSSSRWVTAVAKSTLVRRSPRRPADDPFLSVFLSFFNFHRLSLSLLFKTVQLR